MRIIFIKKKKKSYILNEKCCICFSQGLWKEACYRIESLILPTIPSLFWLPPIPRQLVESVPPTHSLSCSVFVLVMVFPIPTFSSLLQSSDTWPGPPSASQSHGPCSSGWFSFLFPLISSTISQRLSDYIIFIPSSTLLPPKLYGVFYTLLCLFVYFSYFIVQDSLRSSASSVSYLSLSQ